VSEVEAERFGLIGAGAAATLVSKLISTGAGFLFTVLAVRLLPLSEYGVLASGLSVVGIGGAVAVLGVGPAIVREVAASKARDSEADLVHLASASFSTLAIMGSLTAAGLMWLLLSDNRAAPTDVLIVLGVGLSLLLLARATIAITASFAQALRMMRLYALVSPMMTVFQLLAVAVVFVVGAGSLESLAVALGIAATIAIVASGWLLRRRIIGRPGWLHLSARRAWALVVLAGPYALSTAAFRVIGNLDVVVLSITGTSAEVGLYQPTLRITTAFVTLVPALMLTGFVPLATSLYVRGSADEFQVLFRRTTKFIVVLTGPVFVVLASAPESVLTILLGPRFAGVGDIVRILLIGYAVNTIFGVNTAALIASGARRELTKVYVSTMVVMVALSLLLIPPLGPVGAAWSTTGAITYLNGAVGYALNARTGAHPFHSDIAFTALALLVAIGAAWLVAAHVEPAAMKIAVGLGAATLWGAALFVFRLVTLGEIKTIAPTRRRRSAS
jgi:O-antigen/teichoic acid export membrane protein